MTKIEASRTWRCQLNWRPSISINTTTLLPLSTRRNVLWRFSRSDNLWSPSKIKLKFRNHLRLHLYSTSIRNRFKMTLFKFGHWDTWISLSRICVDGTNTTFNVNPSDKIHPIVTKINISKSSLWLTSSQRATHHLLLESVHYGDKFYKIWEWVFNFWQDITDSSEENFIDYYVDQI